MVQVAPLPPGVGDQRGGEEVLLVQATLLG